MAEPCLIYDDPRPIKSIWFDFENQLEVGTGTPPVEKIVAYKDHGVGDFMPWIAVYREGQISDRIPAWKVEITYA